MIAPSNPASVPLVVVDLDGTITRGDTFIAFLFFVLCRRSKRLLHCLGLPLKFAQFKLGRATRDEFKHALVKAILAGCSRHEVERFTASFIDRRFPVMAKRKAVECIEWHRRQGHVLLLATGSLDVYAAAIGHRLGFDRVIATRAAWDEDRITGGFEGGNLRGEAKLAEVRSALRLSGQRPSRIIAYSDHHSDLPLLYFADEAIAVDPTPSLARLARIYGFSIANWTDPTSVPPLGRGDPVFCQLPSKK